jgi:hypothetical protein
MFWGALKSLENVKGFRAKNESGKSHVITCIERVGI